MDTKLLEFLLAKGIPTFSMASGLTLDDFGWGTPTFHKWVRGGGGGGSEGWGREGASLLCGRL